MKQIIKYETKSGKLFNSEEDAKRMETAEELLDKYDFFNPASEKKLSEEHRELLLPFLFVMLKKGIIKPGGVVNKALDFDPNFERMIDETPF